jgi:hypothetical protein
MLSDTTVSEEYAASIFKVKVCRLKLAQLYRQTARKMVTETQRRE